MNYPHVWLRAETKQDEKRSPITPDGAKQLIKAGFTLTVEQCAHRIFNIEDYQLAGCQLAQHGSWVNAPTDAIIIGLKELPEHDSPLHHRHIYFAHAYKQQQDWQQLLGRFKAGGGSLYDLEYLLDERQRRIAAFGYWAGFAGAALGLKAWVNQKFGITPPLADVSAYNHKAQLFSDLDSTMARLGQSRLPPPKILVIGALGRSGQGAVDFAGHMGLQVIKWDIGETAAGGPFEQLNQIDIVVNCVFVQQPVPPFITNDMLQQSGRKLSMIVDVSCDPYGSYNPLPIYQQCTSFRQPCLNLIAGDKPLDLIAIDHLPSLLPKESSEDYATQLLQHLITLNDLNLPVWSKALEIFNQKTAEI